MNSPQADNFKLSKRVRFISKLVGYKSALEITGASKLGQGVTGAVFSSGGAAIKVAQTSKDRKSIEHETKILSDIRRTRVVPNLLGSGRGYLAIQKFNGMPLKDYLSRINSDIVFADYIFRRVVEAIGSLHRNNIAQRDLHSGNIFITEDYEVKIIDYGQALKGYPATYFETFFGNNTDPSTGALGLVSHLFTKTKSYQTYSRILKSSIEKICKKRGADPKIVLLDYSTIEGNQTKEDEYFDNLERITSPDLNDSSDVTSFYNAIDSALRINTKNPGSISGISSRTSLVSKNKVVESVNKTSNTNIRIVRTAGVIKGPNKGYRVRVPKGSAIIPLDNNATRKTKSAVRSSSNILQFESGGFVPSSESMVVELHGEELVVPKKAIKKFKNDIHREIAIGILIAYKLFPHTNEGIAKATKIIDEAEHWLAPSDLPQYYNDIDSDLMTGKETPGIIAIREILRKFYGIDSPSAETKDFVDTSQQESTEIEEVSPPNIPPAHYIQGQSARWQPEFESDIDHAIYFAGKSPLPKGAKQREVLNWLKSLGLTYEQIHDHREKVLEKIRKTIDLPGVEEEYPYVYIDAVDQDFVLEDDILEEAKADDSVIVDEEPAEDKQEVEAQADVATQVLVEAENAQEESIDESVLDDLPDDLKNTLVDFINKKTGKEPEKEKKKRTSSYVSNRKIFNFLTNNLLKIQGQLDAVNDNITRQNQLLQANLEVSSGIYENIDIQNTILLSKLDQILQAISGQNEAAKKFAEDEEKRIAEENLESARDAASTETAMSTLGNDGAGSNSLMRRLVKFFGKKIAKRLWQNLVPRRLRARARLAKRKIGKIKSLPKRLAQRLGSKLATNVLKKPAQTAVTNVSTRAAIKGFEHIALPGVTRAIKTADAPAAKAIAKSDNFLVRALKSPAIQKALVKVMGEEGAKKLSVKVAAKLIPGVSTAYGLGEGLARIAMGDLKGGFLSFGSAIPFGGGYAFAAVDILRDINIDAYTKHIESNLPLPSNENFAAFFTEALGVTPDQYELGGTTGSQTVMLHGTELLIPPDQKATMSSESMNPVGGVMLAAATQYINKLGAVGAPIAPMFEQVAAPLAKVYDVPSTLVQTNVGGSLPSFQSTLKKAKEKKKMTAEEELSGMEKDLLETQNPESFADKLLKIIDPEGRFQELLKQINNRSPVGETGEGMATFGESGIDKGTGWNAPGWVHGHFQNSNKQALVNDTFDVVKRLVNSGVKTVITATNKDITKEMSDAEIKKHIEAGVDGHKKYGSGVYAIDVSVPTGTKVPFELENVYDSKGRGGVVGTMRGRTTQIMHLAPGSKAGAAPTSTTPSNTPTSMPTGEHDVIIPLDHVKPGNQNKIPDKRGGNTFQNASATGAAGRERQHQDKAAAKVKAKLEAKGLKVKIIAPEDFGNYEDYDKYISAQAAKGVRVVPLHFDAAVGQGGTGFLTRTRAGDSGDAALASPIQKALSTFQRSNPSLGNLGPTDTVNNATINRASASPAALVEMGSMVAWERQHGANFTSSTTFDKLATGIAEGIYQGGGFNKVMRPPTQRQPAKSKYYLRQGGDKKADTQIIMIPASSTAGKAIEKNSTVEGQRFTYDANYNVFKSQNEISSVERARLLRRLGLN